MPWTINRMTEQSRELKSSRVLFSIKVNSIILISLVLVGIIGLLAYQNFSRAIVDIEKASIPDVQLVTLTSLATDVTNAENNIKSYSLSNDSVYLNNFYKFIATAQLKLERLENEIPNDSSPVLDIDSLSLFVKKKFKLLNEVVSLRENYRVPVALDKVMIRLENSSEKQEKEYEDVKQNNISKAAKLNSEEKKGLAKLFSWFKTNENKKDSIDNLTTDNSDKVESNKEKNDEETVSLAEVSIKVNEVKKEEELIELKLRKKEISIFDQDRVYSEKLNYLVNDFVAKEDEANQSKRAQIQKLLDSAKKLIIVISILIFLLLLTLSYLIVRYVENNIRVRTELRNATKRAEDLAQTKSRFLANMSHEIRTPMNAISGFTEQLLLTDLNRTQKEQLEIVHSSVDHLRYLVNDILDVTKLQAGKLELESINFSLKTLVDDVLIFIEPLMDSKDVNLELTYDSSISDEIIGDPYRTRQILLNLISNAAKFTNSGSVEVELKKLGQHESIQNVLFRIRDTGIGMSEEQLKRIFEEFEQGEKNVSRFYGGTGLGLSITKMLVELSNGSISIQSEQKVGTTVEVKIPFEIGSSEEIINEKNKDSNDSIMPIKSVLVVDDEPYNRKLLKAIFKKYKVELTEAEDGDQVMGILADDSFDLILMDARMPRVNGIESSKQIRSSENQQISKIPIIMLTAAVLDVDMEMYQEAGVNSILAKPFKENELIKEIEAIFDKKV